MHPYRSPIESTTREDRDEARHLDRVLAGTLVVVWLLSVTRVVLGLLHREHFGGEGAIAFALVVYLPFALKNGVS